MSSLQFNAVLLEISNQLSAQQLEDLKFMCRDVIGKRDQEKINSGLKLFQYLTERGKLGEANTEYLSDLLQKVHRQDLADRIGAPYDPIVKEPGEAERAKLDIATEVIAENLGKTWRKLGRKLGLKDVKLDSIHRRHPTELEETVVELLREWRKSRGAEARVEELIKALRDCQYNLTADKVEDKLRQTALAD
ncbi:protein FADD [Toxotes jaculatrix]|uniref:protein FADD n=1 Tax=Toxotes jaculatrix TaxID=941984 RepID=UPI001B3AC799|nr:protein FADD [Toxotes jaculatrix]